MAVDTQRLAKMESPARRPAKTEVLSMRMDPKTRFLVEILARYRGQSISTVVERAILEAADNARIGNHDAERTWRDYWHISEGVRALNMAADQALYPTYDEESRFAFAKTHWPFFFVSSTSLAARQAFVDILWPRIDEFLEQWEATKSTDYFAVGKAMQQALRDAGVQAPDWPVKPIERQVVPPPPSLRVPPPPPPTRVLPPPPGSSAPTGGDLDDEIPF